MKNFNNIVKLASNGSRELNLSKFDPIYIENLLPAEDNGNGFRAKFYDALGFGLSKLVFTKAKSNIPVREPR